MAIAIIAPNKNVNTLQQHLEQRLPGVAIEVYPNISNPSKIKMAILWKQAPDSLKDMNALKLLQSFGAGVDHILEDDTLPKDLPVARVVDLELNIGMSRYVCMAVLNFHKNLYTHLQQQAKRTWTGLAETPLKIGVMGMGVLGSSVAKSLQQLGFEVFGFATRPKMVENITCFSTLPQFLSQVNCLVCLLPLTPETRGILNRSFFEHLNKGSFLINVGRGAHLVEQDLLWAIEEGIIDGACLDVLEKEPLPKDHPFWSNPKIILTPHIASVTNQETAAQQMAENYQRLLNGEAPLNQINLQKGY